MDYFSMCLNFICLLAQSFLSLFFVSRLTGKRMRIRHFAAYLALLLCLAWIAGRISLPWMLSAGANLLVLWGITHFALGNQRSVSWIAAAISFYISQLSFGVVNSLEALIFPYHIGSPTLYLLVCLATALSLSLCACCYRAVLKFLPLREQVPVSHTWMLLLPILFFFATEMYILQTSYTQAVVFPQSQPFAHLLQQSGKHMGLFTLQALGLGALLATLYAYRRVYRDLQTQKELSSLTWAIHAQKVYVAEAGQRYARTKAFRHDIRNHLSVLDGLLKNKNYEESRIYLEKLKAASSSLSLPCQTGNPIVDILLGEKLALAAESGIGADVSLFLPGSCGIDDFDLCVIFANALDNAVSACQEGPSPRSVRILGKRQGNYLMLEFTNTCSPGPLPPAGTGLLNIKTVAEKYHGAILTEKEETRFSLHVLLDISLH